MRDYRSLVTEVLNKQKNMTNNSMAKTDTLLSLWVCWYNGYYEKFHHYFTYNGRQRVYHYKKSLKMAKRVCEDWASLLMSEKVDIVVDDKIALHDVLKDINFWTKANRAVEVGFALSFSSLVCDLENLGINEDGTVVKTKYTKVRLNYYNATKTVPITFENGEIVECAFVSVDTKYTYVNLHIRDDADGFYHIVSCKQDNQTNQFTYSDLKTTSKKPLFAIIQPNIENNLFINSPYPLSVFANAIDILKSVDNIYDAFDNEITLGRKRIFVSTSMNEIKYDAVDAEGKPVARIESTFDPNDTLIYGLPSNVTLNNDKPLLYSPADALRVTDYVNGLNNQLQHLSNAVGLGNDYYNFSKSGGVITATQVISEKSDTFRNLKKHEILLEKSLQTIIEAIIYCNNAYTENPTIKEQTPTIIFDDSIIEDNKAEQERDDKNLANGSMSLVEYRMKWFGEEEKEAREKVYEINGRVGLSKRLDKYLQAFNSGLMTPKMFVNLAYTDDDLKACGVTREELINELLGTKPSGGAISADEIKAMAQYDESKNPNTDKPTEEPNETEE